MVYLTKGQRLYDNQALVVYDPTGYYEDGAVVACASAGNPEVPVCSYEAKFAAFGNIVYSISDQAKLDEEIAKITSNSLYGKSQEDLAAEQVISNIQTVDQPQTPVAATPAPETSQPQPNPVTQQFDNSTTTAPIPSADVPPSTSSPSFVSDVLSPVPDSPVEALAQLQPADAAASTTADVATSTQ